MEQFEPKVLILSACTLEVWALPSSEPISDGFKQEDTKLFKFFLNECKALGLTTTLQTINRATQLLSRPDPPRDEFQNLCSEALGRLRDELNGVHLMSFTTKESLLYEEWWDGWEDTVAKFGSALWDIEEASKCLACGRATATVFHLMRVMEHGLKATSNELGIPYAPSWESHLDQIKRKIEVKWKNKTPEEKKDEPFFRDVLATLQIVKISWRNPTMHIVNHYTIEQAQEIFNAVKAFMRHLSTKLGENS